MPLVKQPALVPFHISAFTNNQTLLDKPSSLSTLRASTPTSSNNTSRQNINNSEADLITAGPSKEAKSYRNQKKTVGSSLSGSKVRHRDKDSKQNLNYLRDEENEDEYNQINPTGSGNLLQPQLVPIQTFSFFKWEINVDTLVRIFIIA